MHGERIRVWDLPVRVFHWGLVATFAIAWLTSEDAEAPHHWAGYVAFGLLAFRVAWGFVGSRHARFADFVPRPAELRAYVGKLVRGREPRHLGHNPAAAVMILFLMAMVALIGTTGWLMTTDWGWGSEALEELHEGAVNATLLALVVHVAAAVFESLRHRENLVRAMITGYKRP
ncbi:cytochrome b/b6 domain-containing protein [Aromatoleum evansii]|uniref:Cytochrome b/b6 domain-containing protein n=1 Tax=Aromatoleum evansii TaxID=59406 RepID=A0ABZ1AMZ3_AROEV|nr:cytochrome b/b6 domain-containing protein [Aromatoleum evansii]NMG31908.1 cytochrome B [Aromatoleum evansii]WRL46820.1 cytochrome b/b6 domain-containing protein [Aromatoleum evansii]